MSIMASFTQQAKRFAGRGTRNMLAAAGLGLLAVTAAVAPSYAQQAGVTQIAATTEITADTKCKDYKPGQGGQSAICEIKKGEVLKAQERVLDQQLITLAQKQRCTDFLISGIKQGSLDKDAVRAAYNGRPVQQVHSCEIAAKFGYNPS